ncbi:MAG: caspase family protein [Longimicrobiales bacterium]
MRIRKLRGALIIAAVSLPLITSSASAQKIAFKSQYPRTLVFIQEKGDGTTASRHVSDYLRQAGFPLIDPALAHSAAQRELVAAAMKGDEGAAVALGRDFGAQVIILGTADWGTGPNPGDPRTLVGTAEVDVRAIRLDGGKVVGTSKRGNARAQEATEQSARSLAIHRALDNVLNETEFVGAIANNWGEVPWSPDDYFNADPGSLGAVNNGSTGPKLAIIRTDILPPIGADAASRGIGIMKKGTNATVVNEVDIEGVVVGKVAAVMVEGKDAKLSALDDESKTKLGLTGPATRFLARISLPQTQDTVSVMAIGESGEKAIARAAPRIGQRWAVIIGVSEYVSPDIRDLAYASKDAQAMYDFLRSSAAGPFAEDHVLMLKDGAATGQAIREAMFVFLQKAQWNDLVVVYFAGHGAADPALPDNLYLLPTDADVKSLAATGFPMWDVKTALRRQIRAERVIVIADACHSGGTAASENPISGSFSELFTPSRRLTLTAAAENEQSLEDTKWGGGHGVFTYQLLEGLKGAADADNNGIVTFNEVADYVGTRVKTDTGNRQNPVRSGLGDVPLAETNRPVSGAGAGK